MSGAYVGREVTFGPVGGGSNLIAGTLSKDITFLGEPLDTTDSDANGFDTSLIRAGEPVVARKGVSVAITGYAKSKALLDAGVGEQGAAFLDNYVLTDVENDVSWTGDWVVFGVSITNPNDEVAQISFTAKTTGAFTYDPDSTT